MLDVRKKFFFAPMIWLPTISNLPKIIFDKLLVSLMLISNLCNTPAKIFSMKLKIYKSPIDTLVAVLFIFSIL